MCVCVVCGCMCVVTAARLSRECYKKRFFVLGTINGRFVNREVSVEFPVINPKYIGLFADFSLSFTLPFLPPLPSPLLVTCSCQQVM